MSEKKLKIIQIDGLPPRKAMDYQKNFYDFKEELVKNHNESGKEIVDVYPVFELPYEFALMKIAGAPDRYKPFGGEDVTTRVPGPNSAMKWHTFPHVKFELETKNVVDQKKGGFKKDPKTDKPIVVQNSIMKDSTGKVVECKPYRTEEK